MPLSPRRCAHEGEQVLARSAAVALLVRRAAAGWGGRSEPLKPSGFTMPSWRMMSPHDRPRGGGGERQDRQAAELALEPAQLPVGGPEVVPPLADAVRLVDRHQRHAHARRARRAARPRAPRAPRRPARTRRAAGARCRSRRVGPSSVELRTVARKPARSSASTWSFMSEMSGRDHQHRARQDARRDLVGERLAGAGRHDADAVAAAEHGRDELLLARAELGVAEDVAQDVAGRRAAAERVRGRCAGIAGAASGRSSRGAPLAPTTSARACRRRAAGGAAAALGRLGAHARHQSGPSRQRAHGVEVLVVVEERGDAKPRPIASPSSASAACGSPVIAAGRPCCRAGSTSRDARAAACA